MASTATTSTVAQVNRTAVLEALQHSGPLSRQALEEVTGLSAATVTRLTTALLDEGLISADGRLPSTGGRKPLLFRFAGHTKVVAVIQIDQQAVQGLLVDLDEQVVARLRVGHRGEPARPGRDPLDACMEVMQKLLDEAQVIGKTCLGVGVCVPGLVDHRTGGVSRVPELGWNEMPLGTMLGRLTTLPVLVDNDANALAAGETAWGAARGLRDVVAIDYGAGIGAGIVTDGEVRRGAHNAAGEIGFLLTGTGALAKTHTRIGDLESRVGTTGVAALLRASGADAAGEVSVRQLVDLAATGDAAAAQALTTVLDALALAVAAITVVVDPELIVLGRGLIPVADTVSVALRERLTDRIPMVPGIVPAGLGADASLLGMAASTIRATQNYTYVEG